MSGKMEINSWLPLHFIIMGSSLVFISDLILLPRVISLIFGILTIIFVGLLADALFKKREITFYAVIITLLIPQRIILSSVPLPEIIFFFFVLSASLFILKYINDQRLSYIIYSAIFLTAANALRYEAWFISVSLAVYVLFSIKELRKQLPVLLLLSSFPLYWLAFNYIKNGDFLYFINEPGIYYDLVREDTFFNRIKLNPLMQFIEQNLLTFNFICAAGIYLLWKENRIKSWLIVLFTPLLFLSAVSLYGMTLPAHNFWRTSAVWIMLLIPFSSYVIYKVRKLFSFNLAAGIILLSFPLMLIYSNRYYIETAARYSLNENNINAARKIIRYMYQNAEKKDRILIEHAAHFEHFEIVVSSQEPFRFIYSKRNELTPIKEEDYSGVTINYYLVKTSRMKEKLNEGQFRKVLEHDGWELFSREAGFSVQ
jgi:hypothetical protein